MWRVLWHYFSQRWERWALRLSIGQQRGTLSAAVYNAVYRWPCNVVLLWEGVRGTTSISMEARGVWLMGYGVDCDRYGWMDGVDGTAGGNGCN